MRKDNTKNVANQRSDNYKASFYRLVMEKSLHQMRQVREMMLKSTLRM